MRFHSLRFGAHLSLFLRPVLGAMGAAELTREADDAMQSLLSEYVSLLGAVGAAAVGAVDSRAVAAAAATPFGPSGGGEEAPFTPRHHAWCACGAPASAAGCAGGGRGSDCRWVTARSAMCGSSGRCSGGSSRAASPKHSVFCAGGRSSGSLQRKEATPSTT